MVLWIGNLGKEAPGSPALEKPLSLFHLPDPFQTLGALHISAVCDESPVTFASSKTGKMPVFHQGRVIMRCSEEHAP